jgi:hypothetical protein
VALAASFAMGILFHAAWMIFLLVEWEPRFLPWPSYTDSMHTTVFLMPRSGWEIEPLTAGMAGVFFPLSFSIFGLINWRLGGAALVRDASKLPILGVGIGLGIALNLCLMHLLLCLEN